MRLPVAKAAILFDLVKTEGAEITITGYSPTVAPTVASVRAKQREAADASYAAGPSYGYADTGYANPPSRPARGGYDGLFGSVY